MISIAGGVESTGFSSITTETGIASGMDGFGVSTAFGSTDSWMMEEGDGSITCVTGIVVVVVVVFGAITSGDFSCNCLGEDEVSGPVKPHLEAKKSFSFCGNRLANISNKDPFTLDMTTLDVSVDDVMTEENV